MSNRQTIALSKIIQERGIEVAKLLLQQFTCKRNSDIELFLRNKAIRFETASAATTHLILGEQGLLGYFSLSFKSIEVDVSKTLLKKLTSGLTNSNRLNVYLIAQIGKNESISNNNLNLKYIIDEILGLIHTAQKAVGGKVIILECEDNPSLIKLYEQHGFHLIDTKSDENGLKTMYIIPKFN